MLRQLTAKSEKFYAARRVTSLISKEILLKPMQLIFKVKLNVVWTHLKFVVCDFVTQDALRYENGRTVCGSSIIVEWAKGPRRGVRKDTHCFNGNFLCEPGCVDCMLNFHHPLV